MTSEVIVDEAAQVRLWHRVSQFLFREARLLDEWRLAEWYDEMLTDDIRYVVPATDVRDESTGALKLIDDNAARLRQRIEQLLNGEVWCEDPRSRTNRMISNVEIVADQGGYPRWRRMSSHTASGTGAPTPTSGNTGSNSSPRASRSGSGDGSWCSTTRRWSSTARSASSCNGPMTAASPGSPAAAAAEPGLPARPTSSASSAAGARAGPRLRDVVALQPSALA